MTENRTERTDNLGLLAIMSAPAGGGPGSNTQGWGFPYWNQVYLDALLAALHEAPRDGVALLTAPAVAPTVALSATDGYLPAGQTLEVVQTWVDEWGRETGAGTVGTVSTGTALVDPLVAPTLGAPSAAAAGFDGGLLEVAYSWFDDATGETLSSPVASVSVPYRTGGLQSEVLVTLPVTPASVGAAGAFIYARHRSGNWVRAAAISVDTETEETLDGTWISCFVALPLANSTGSTNAIDITGIADASGDAALTRFYVRQSGETWTAGDRRLEVGGVDEWDPATVSYPLLYSGASGEMAPGYPPTTTQFLPIRPVDLSAGEVTGRTDDATASTTCGGTTTQDFTITLEATVLLTELTLAVTSAGTIDYDIELFEDSGRTTLAYKAENIAAAAYDDRIPLEWFGGATCYGTITNHSADALTDIDLTIKFRR